MEEQENTASVVDAAVEQGGAYEIIRKRLLEQGRELEAKAKKLNESRLVEFGSSEMSVASRVRVRTENNCVARDVVQVGEYLVFGYNVFIGLKSETKVTDVFSLFKIVHSEEGAPQLEEVGLRGSFLDQSSFVNDFKELYSFYKNSRLVELTINNGKLLAGFQIGERAEDKRVFRWSVSADGAKVSYIDNRGERDIELPPRYDFEWQDVTREFTVHGRHPHFNILDTVFVETVGGDLTVKIENNTDDGLGIYREPVDDPTQSLDDADVSFASVGDFILLRIRPYREEVWRYLVYNRVTREVSRVDAIGESCVQLPENHGIIFPGGYYLQTGEFKTFDEQSQGLRFKRVIKSPNGEDVLYVFYEPVAGLCALFSYNLINKELQNPIYGNGYALAANGQLIILSAEGEPTRVHPMQIWDTQFVSVEYASNKPASQNFYGRIGNAELVRGISDFYSIGRLINNQKVSAALYEELSSSARKMFDAYYWLQEPETDGIAGVLQSVSETAELVLDEFEKVESIREQAITAMREAETAQKDIFQLLHPDSWETPEEFVDALDRIRHQRGHLLTIKEYRYIDVARIDELDAELVEKQAELGELTVEFLAREDALDHYHRRINELNKKIEIVETVAQLEPHLEAAEKIATGLDLLSELMATLKVSDATLRTRIIDAITEVYSKLNQTRASAKHKQKNLGSEEAVAQFGAQFKLFSQSVANALGMASTPEKCDEQLSRLLVQLEELESQFSGFDQFLTDILDKREEIYESFENHKQQLLDERQRKAQSVADAAARILQSIERRSMKFTEAEELNTYFASDALVLKVYELVEQLRELDDAVKADDVEARFKASKEQALRALRDKSDIYEEGGNIIKLGPRHKFSVNSQELDLTIIPRDGELNIHLTGTDFFEEINNERLNELREYWDISLESESPQVYRAEYLAWSILHGAQTGLEGLSMDKLKQVLLEESDILKLVRDFTTPRYKEGYEKGIHDHDAVLLLKKVVPAVESAGLLRFDPLCRGFAAVFWANTQNNEKQQFWIERANSAARMENVFASRKALDLLVQEVDALMQEFLRKFPIAIEKQAISRAAHYLVAELSQDIVAFQTSRYARHLADELKRSLDDQSWRKYQLALEKIKGLVADRWQLTQAWLQAMVDGKDLQHLQRYIPEAIGLINCDQRIDRQATETDLELKVDNLMGDHPLISERSLSFALDDFLSRLDHHRHVVIPGYHAYLDLRQEIIDEERDKLRLKEYKPRPLSSFVRNKLINDVYLPIIGDNLAKQMGTVGENKRTDLMGLLMMISPPGYGKTTLMEYVASRLGLIFMKINCPSLGHDVLSLDPVQAPNATARQELIKLNLGLEMGSNVMLYLDDIQHTHPEFLQKFISLCDGTRRIEGVWKDKTKTYDMRGKKFCVVMAGNPYTESGEMFKIPDMLANRADIYNLGDILGGTEEQFELSYIENSMTSNPALAPLATREMGDIYKLIDLAKGKPVATTDLSHSYSGAEINEITEVFKKMFVVQDVILKVNQQYIASAAQADKYRTEPPFKLQGSYRNMNKMVEKISAVMNEEELMTMIADHYLGEAQLLTSGAEENLLKLAELRGNMTGEEQQRWEQIKRDFLRNKSMGGDDADSATKVANQIAHVAENLSDLQSGMQGLAPSLAGLQQEVSGVQQAIEKESGLREPLADIVSQLQALQGGLANPSINVTLDNQPFEELGKLSHVLDDTVGRLMTAVEKSVDFDITIIRRITKLSAELRTFSEKTQLSRSSKKVLDDFEGLVNDKPKTRGAKSAAKTRNKARTAKTKKPGRARKPASPKQDKT